MSEFHKIVPISSEFGLLLWLFSGVNILEFKQSAKKVVHPNQQSLQFNFSGSCLKI